MKYFLLLVLAALLIPVQVNAQCCQNLITQGKTLMNTGKYVEAKAKFQDAKKCSDYQTNCASSGVDALIRTCNEKINPTQSANCGGKYDYVHEFTEGFAYVRKNGLYGYVNTACVEIVPPKYDDAWPFSSKRAKVQVGEMFGYIDQTGKLIIPTQYSQAENFYNGRAVIIHNGEYNVIDLNGNKIYDDMWPFADDRAPVILGDYQGFVNSRGEEVIPCTYQDVASFHDGVAYVIMEDGYNFIDVDGNNVYDYAGKIEANRVRVRKGDKWGYVNRYGVQKVPMIYDDAWGFSLGLAPVRKGNLLGFIDTTGKAVIPIEYDDVWSFEDNGLALVLKVDDEGDSTYNFLKTNGVKYFDEVGTFKNGIARCIKAGRWGFVDLTGNIVIPCKYDKVWTFQEERAPVTLNNKYGFVDSEGNEVIPLKYDDVWAFNEGYALVKMGEKYGYIDINGKKITEFIYDDGESFKNGRAKVLKNGNVFYINTKGDCIADCP